MSTARMPEGKRDTRIQRCQVLVGLGEVGSFRRTSRMVFTIVMPMTPEIAAVPRARQIHNAFEVSSANAAPASAPFRSAHEVGFSDELIRAEDPNARPRGTKQLQGGRSIRWVEAHHETSQALDDRRKAISRRAPSRRAGVHIETLMTDSVDITPRPSRRACGETRVPA